MSNQSPVPKEGRSSPDLIRHGSQSPSVRHFRKYGLISVLAFVCLFQWFLVVSHRSGVAIKPVKTDSNHVTVQFEYGTNDHLPAGSVTSGQGRNFTAETTSSQTKLHPETWSPRPASFDHTLDRVLSMLPDEIHIRELLRPITNGGAERMRELGHRTRQYKQYFEAWEDLHSLQDETGEISIKDNVIQYLRATQSPDIPGDGPIESGSSANAALAQKLRTYEAFRSFMSKFSNLLFPWTMPYFGDHMSLHASLRKGGRGIVLSARDDQIPFLLTSIYTFRKLGCTLPIEVLYLGDADLPEDRRWELEVGYTPVAC